MSLLPARVGLSGGGVIQGDGFEFRLPQFAAMYGVRSHNAQTLQSCQDLFATAAKVWSNVLMRLTPRRWQLAR